MRLLMVCGPTAYGSAACVRYLTQAAVAAGLDTTVASPENGLLPGWVKEAGASWVRLPLTREVSFADLACLVSLRHLMQQADVVHLHSSKAGALGRIVAVMPGRTGATIFTPHGWSWNVGGRGALVYRGIERALSRVGATVCVSHDEAVDGHRVLGSRARLQTITNGVDTKRFTPDGEAASRGNDPLVLVVGRFCHQKGQDIALRVLAELTVPGARLRFVGGGDDAEARALAARLGVSSRVEWVGEADPAPHYRAADVVLIPSRYDGLSLALLEAMASGCAVVSTDVPGASALGDCGMIAPQGDVRALAVATGSLLSDPAMRLDLGQSARRRAMNHYGLDRYGVAWVATWRATSQVRRIDRGARRARAGIA